MASSQPQPIHQHHRQYQNAQEYSHLHYQNSSASQNSSSGPINHDFNPASYTRHFLGSPISWRAASFGSHLFPNGSPNFMNIDHSDLKKLSSSIDNEQSAGTFFNALSSLDQGDLCRNYTCCGIHLNDLHALLEHFEIVHVVVVDDVNGPTSQITLPFNPQPLPTPRPNPVQTNPQNQQAPQPQASQQPPNGYFPYAGAQQHQDPAAFDPDDMDIEMDTAHSPNKRTPSSGAPSPPDTPVTTPSVSHPFPISVHTTHAYNPHANTYHSQPPSPNRINTFDSSTLLRPLSAFANPVGAAQSRPDVFHPYSGFNSNSNSSSSSIAGAMGDSMPGQSQECVPPALLFSSADVSPKDGSTSPRSAPSSPDHVPANTNATTPASRTSATISRPATSMLLSKPFRCPKPNCNKSYKQANGLKYHITHGSCNFTPAKEVEQVQAIIAQRQNSHPSSPTTPHSNDPGALGTGLSENELREVEKEAERQLRPFACGVGDCQRRYKNMNGLRYHYQHTGEHGAIGLALLASGTHPCLSANRHASASASASKESRRVGSRASSRAGSRPTTPPLMSPPPFPASLQQQATVQNYTQPVTAVPVQMGFVNGSRVH